MKIENLAAANLAMMNVWAADRASLSQKQQDVFDVTITSPVAPEALAYFVEFVFANRECFSKPSLDAAANVADFASFCGFYGLAVDLRGNMIAASLRGKPAKTDPEPLARFTSNNGALAVDEAQDDA